MGNEALEHEVIPFKLLGQNILPYLKERANDRAEARWSDWPEIYGTAAREVEDYVKTGKIPKNGFTKVGGGDCRSFFVAVLSANDYLLSLPYKCQEAYWALCTSSVHCHDLRQYEHLTEIHDNVQIERALSNDYKVDDNFRDLPTSFKSKYQVKRGHILSRPFEITFAEYPHHHALNPVLLLKGMDDHEILRNLETSILDAYKSFSKSGGWSDSNIKIEVFLVDIRLNHHWIQLITRNFADTKLEDGRFVNIVEALPGTLNFYRTVPNYRVTIRDNQGQECYLTIGFIELPSFETMLVERAKTLRDQIGREIRNNQLARDRYSLASLLNTDLNYIAGYRSELAKNSFPIKLEKYQLYIKERNYYQLRSYRFFNNRNDNLSNKLLHAAYHLLESYNHYLTLDEFVPIELPKFIEPLTKVDEPKVIDVFQGYLYQRLQNFGRSRKNYAKQDTNTQEWEFEREPAITEQLKNHLDCEQYIVVSESSENTGNVDIKIHFNGLDIEPLMIEGKLIKEGDNTGQIVKKIKSAVHQLDIYREHNNARGMLLFFTLEANEGRVARKIELNEDSLNFEFTKLKPKTKYEKFKITHIVTTEDGAEYPVRFMKLRLKTPSQG